MAIDYPEPHRREGLIGTLVVHGVLLLLFHLHGFQRAQPAAGCHAGAATAWS